VTNLFANAQMTTCSISGSRVTCCQMTSHKVLSPEIMQINLIDSFV